MASDCTGYHWSGGQYVMSSCSGESSTFFIILGFTMLVLVLLLFVIVIIACIRKHRIRIRARQIRSAIPSHEDDCVINLDGSGQPDPFNGRNMENVKCVIMAGEERPSFVAHPIPSNPPSDADSPIEEEEKVHPHPGEHHSGESSDQEKQEEVV